MKKNNKYIGQIWFIVVLTITILISIAIWGLSKELDYRVLIFGAPYQYWFLPALSLFFSIFIFLFLNSKVYRAWRWFAVVAMPLIIIIIATIPRNDYFGREAWTIFLSVLFFIITLLIIIYKSIRLKFTKKAEKR